MRKLDAINPKGMRPSRFTSICACLPIMLGLISLPLAHGAAPNVPLAENPASQLIFIMLAGAVMIALISVICRWGWEIKYYGFSLFFGISISMLAIVPLLAFMVYGKSALLVKIVVLLFYLGSHAVWCRKFIRIYRGVFESEILRSIVYEEEPDAVYYMRRGDRYLLSKYFKFSQTPRERHFAVFVGFALALMPMMGSVREFAGVPFAHVFLLVAMVPVSWMSFGFAIRSWLVCYFYPAKIKKSTGKDVYVDIVTAHRRLDK